MQSLIKYLLMVVLTATVVGCLKRNQLPDLIELLEPSELEPVQQVSDHSAFNVDVEGERYQVQPKFDYEISGLVVSYRVHNGDVMLRKSWSDHLNIADLCIVWGKTAQAPTLNKLKFWNGQFTCNVKTRDQAAWDAFDMHQLSNNHLLSDDINIRSMIGDVKVGDQVKISGWLASYKNLRTGGNRGTSTTRTDSGNGACETIYVQSFDIISEGNNPWRKVFYLGMFSLFCLFALYLMLPPKARD